MRQQRIGLIVPSSNTVMEPDFHRQFRDRAIVSTARILLEQVTREAELRMLADDLPRAAKLIGTTAPDVIVFGCTSAGSLDGLAHDAWIAREIEQASGARTVTVLQAAMAELAWLHPARVAVLTPYVDELTKSIAGCVAESGYAVVTASGMGLQENLDIGRVTPGEIVSFVEANAAGSRADCLFLSCTNWRAVEALEQLRTKLRIPIVTSNQAAIDAVQEGA